MEPVLHSFMQFEAHKIGHTQRHNLKEMKRNQNQNQFDNECVKDSLY
jgi:hypothetical protein